MIQAARPTFTVVVVSLALVLVAMACTGAQVEKTPPGERYTGKATLRLSAKVNQYSPAALEVSPGQAYLLEITDIAEAHTFTVNAFNVNLTVSKLGTQTLDLVVPANARGDVPFFCSLHVGMAGTLRVKAG